MIKQLLYKWFGIEEVCETCEVLKFQLAQEREEKHILLNKLLERESTPADEKSQSSEFKPIATNTFVPWRARRQALEAEDRAKARVMKNFEEKNPDIEKLEEQLIGVTESAPGTTAS